MPPLSATIVPQDFELLHREYKFKSKLPPGVVLYVAHAIASHSSGPFCDSKQSEVSAAFKATNIIGCVVDIGNELAELVIGWKNKTLQTLLMVPKIVLNHEQKYWRYDKNLFGKVDIVFTRNENFEEDVGTSGRMIAICCVEVKEIVLDLRDHFGQLLGTVKAALSANNNIAVEKFADPASCFRLDTIPIVLFDNENKIFFFEGKRIVSNGRVTITLTRLKTRDQAQVLFDSQNRGASESGTLQLVEILADLMFPPLQLPDDEGSSLFFTEATKLIVKKLNIRHSLNTLHLSEVRPICQE